MVLSTKAERSDVPETENVVTRVTSIPLISSAYNTCITLYNYAKGTHPYVKTACLVAETLAAVAVGSAVGGAQPILNHLEPQIATLNEYACKGLDKLQETLPALQKPTYQVFEDGVNLTKMVVSSTVATAMDAAVGAKKIVVNRVTEAVDLTKDVVQDSVTLTKSVMNSTVNTATDAANGAKELVTHRVTDAVNLTKGTVQDSVELTKSVVSSTVNTARLVAQGPKSPETSQGKKVKGKSSETVQEGIELTSFVRQMVASGVDAMLEKSEAMVDHYLPISDEELVKLAADVQGFNKASVAEQKKQQSYFVRLGSLSSKVRSRAYEHSLNKVQFLKANAQNTLSQLQMVINLIENIKQGVGLKVQESHQLMQLLLEQLQPQQRGQDKEDIQPEMETRTLALLRIVIHDLGPAYQHLVSSIEGLPRSIRQQVDQAITAVHQLHIPFSSAASFQDLPLSVLRQSREKINDARKALDGLANYVVQNAPLNWIVGPFRPSQAATHEATNATMGTSYPSEGKTAEAEAKQLHEMGEAKVGGTLQEMVDVSQPAKQREEEAEKEARKTLVEKEAEEVTAPSDLPKKATKPIKERGEETEKSGLDKISEAPEEES